ncbi:MAG: sulfur carrier protein ThiS [Acidobacteriota bacterium]|nr:sulfur carrier protein ThiS [Acidobacteriota bacterium]MDE3043818.1 sulfur carrier protein ThiS [Acidobacteriota bacterium]MDE3106712.1 sulfur carrier protein ThiS [Acidobacteriota bacterium]MDE3223216.1 sulfur carrier protein ThiS [Acidobacteriota bacterium]
MITVNGEGHELPPMSVASLLAQLRVPSRGVAVALNGEIVTRSTWESVVVEDGDVVEILTAAAGG